MPEVRERKAHDHPLRQRPSDTPSPPRAIGDYAELAVTSNFTFLTGGSHPDEFVRHAAALGYAAIGVTDRNTLAGVVYGAHPLEHWLGSGTVTFRGDPATGQRFLDLFRLKGRAGT